MRTDLASATAPRVPARSTVLVPVGSTEQHGAHLPLDTDTEIAVAVAEAAAGLLSRRQVAVLVAPAIAYGSSADHPSSAGSVSISAAVLRQLLVEVSRSIGTWADRVVLVTAHEASMAAVREAVAQLAGEGQDVDWVACVGKRVDLHPRRTETSLMLHLKPWEVQRGHAGTGRATSGREPLGASADEGMDAIDAMAWDVVRQELDRRRAGVR